MKPDEHSKTQRRKRSAERLKILQADRARRIRLLVDRGWISGDGSIPAEAIPIDVGRSTKVKMTWPACYYEDIEFDCCNCGVSEVWSAESQQYYFEEMQSDPYNEPRLCYGCRQKEVARKEQARVDAGHRPKRPKAGGSEKGAVMRVFLDDERDTPDGWHRVYWPDQAIELLASGAVSEISLDHDLGDDERGTGYDVVLWIEEAVATSGFQPPIIRVHSANSSAREKMERGIGAIQRIWAERSRE